MDFDELSVVSNVRTLAEGNRFEDLTSTDHPTGDKCGSDIGIIGRSRRETNSTDSRDVEKFWD